jgi:hypothetical protein
MSDSESQRYPVGRFSRPTRPLDHDRRAACVAAIEQAPASVGKKVEGLSDADLARTYRGGGWTIRQVVHHLADSHMHAYIRFKFALTEDRPAIKAYDEQRWAVMADVQAVPVSVSVHLLEALHQRWVSALGGMSDQDFLRTYIHPELGAVHLYEALAMYAWHGRHHAAHIALALA